MNKKPAWKRNDNKELVVKPIEVEVYNNDVEGAMKVLKNKMAKEGVLTEIKLRKHYEKPSDKKRREKREGEKKARNNARKREQQSNWRDR